MHASVFLHLRRIRKALHPPPRNTIPATGKKIVKAWANKSLRINKWEEIIATHNYSGVATRHTFVSLPLVSARGPGRRHSPAVAPKRRSGGAQTNASVPNAGLLVPMVFVVLSLTPFIREFHCLRLAKIYISAITVIKQYSGCITNYLYLDVTANAPRSADNDGVNDKDSSPQTWKQLTVTFY